MTNTIKCDRGHEYPEIEQTNLGCPRCLGDYLEKGGTLD